MTAWTLGRVLSWAAKDFAGRGLDAPRLDAEILLAHALGLRRIDLYLRHEQPLTDDELAAMRALVARRRLREPVAYIVGRRDFYGRAFAVDPRVLVPRPETEGLVERALGALGPAGGDAVRALDLCTGSGCVAVTLAAERPDLAVDAVDLSPEALAVAAANAATHGVSARVRCLLGDLWQPAVGPYDLVTANPPYIPAAELDALMPEVRDFEPRLALDGGPEGTTLLAAVVEGAVGRLVPGGVLLVEMHWDQGPRALGLAHAAGFVEAAVFRDWGGHDRYLYARSPHSPG